MNAPTYRDVLRQKKYPLFLRFLTGNPRVFRRGGRAGGVDESSGFVPFLFCFDCLRPLALSAPHAQKRRKTGEMTGKIA